MKEPLELMGPKERPMIGTGLHSNVEEHLVGKPGSSVEVEFTVTNTGRSPTTYFLSAETTIGRIDSPVPPSVELAVDEEAKIKVTIELPSTEGDGTFDFKATAVPNTLFFNRKTFEVYVRSGPFDPHMPSPEALAAAERSLVDCIGKERFDQWLRFVPEKSLPLDVAYYFEPIGTEVVVHLSESLVARHANMVPCCVRDPSLCDFKVTPEQAIEIARKAGMEGELRAGWTPFALGRELAIDVHNCDETMFIDYRDGSVLGKRNESHCGGVP